MTADFEVVPGWYGKIPNLGDFASRRLPQKFVAAWDGWLQQSMSASRAQLGGLWLDAYLHSPIWRFVLMPGVIGDEFWAGLVMPSVDKVGRHFPLTIAVAISARPGILATLMASGNWYAEIENTALAALNTAFTVEQLEARLAQTPFQDSLYQAPDTSAVELAGSWAQPAASFEMTLPAGCSAQHMVCAAGAEWFQAAGAGKSLWWQTMEISSRLTCFSGLPHPDRYATFLQVNDAPRGYPLPHTIPPHVIDQVLNTTIPPV